MADRHQYLEYAIYFDDKEYAETQQAAYPNGVRISPDAALALWLPQFPTMQLVLHDLTTPFFAPSIRSAYFTATSRYPRNTAAFTICRGGWFGICALFGRTTTYEWVAKYYWVPTPVPEVEGVPVAVPPPIQEVTWADGFERETYKTSGNLGAWNAGGASMPVSRLASRHTDGFGLALRGLAAGIEYCSHTLAGHGVAARNASWERFYIRPRKAPTAAFSFWGTNATAANLSGVHVDLLPTLQLAVFDSNAVGTRTLIGSTTVSLLADQWNKLDIVPEYGTGAGGRIRIWLKGSLIFDQTVAAAGGGLGIASNHAGSRLGNISGASGNYEIDIDDWHCMTKPVTFDGLDWLNGHRTSQILPTGFAAGNTFTGDYRGLLRQPAHNGAQTGAVPVVSGGAGSTMRIATDAEYTINKIAGSLGLIYAAFTVVGNTVVDATAAVGYKLGAAAAVMTTVPEAAIGWADRQAEYRPTGLTAPNTTATPLEIHYTRGVGVTPINVHLAHGEACLLGTFGVEDVTDETFADVVTKDHPKLGVHNGPYPRSIWGSTSIPPTAPVIIVAGTYVGNGTAQDLTFRAPVNMFWSRATVTSGMVGNWWWSSMAFAHSGYATGYDQGPMVQACEDTTYVSPGGATDPEERYVVRIAGSDAKFNLAARTYQYIAVIDPGARFMLNGSAMHSTAMCALGGLSDALINAGFLPTGIFFQPESIQSSLASIQFGFKGPGNVATGWHKIATAEQANFLTVAAGLFTPGVNFNQATSLQMPYCAWRTDDGSGDPGIPDVVKIGSYVGNGAASRTISFPGVPTLKRPLFAYVMPISAVQWLFRDPSHTGTTSQDTQGNQNAATGITSGGVNEMTVGSVLNTNGVTFNYFVLMGSDTAGNNGWSINGEFIPVEPDMPFDGPYDDGSESIPPDAGPDPEPDPDPDPGPSDVDDCLAGEVCVEATTREINTALLEVGNTQFLTNYCTQTTREAVIARILYEKSVRATLHAFPWPFATKYADLALTVTQPDDQDWLYSYRIPVDCIFPRRLVVSRGKAADPQPPPFELSSDSSGGLLFTNEALAELEYTCRPACVAYTGDELFKEAVKWHLAAAMAPPLTRMADKAKFCRDQYDLCIAKANAIIKPGQPGLRTAAPYAGDVSAAAVAANLMVANLALVRIGARTIANMTTDQSREAVALNLVFEHELRSALRDFPWKFAKRYNEALVTVGGTSTVPVNVDWQYSYRLPTDYVMVRRLATEGTGRKFEANPKTWEVGTDATGDLLFTDELEPNLEYTSRIDAAVAKGNDLFRDALAWRLAANLAISLAGADPEQEEQRGRGPEYPVEPGQRISHKPNKAAMRMQQQRNAMVMYFRVLDTARAQDANEAEPEDPGDAEWITARE